MSVEQYLQQLQTRLWWQSTAAKTAAVVADYREFFENGLAEGRTEQQMIFELGSPKEVVAALKDERVDLSFLPPGRARIYYGILIALFMLVSLFANRFALWPLILYGSALVVMVCLKHFVSNQYIMIPQKKPAKIICILAASGTVVSFVFGITVFLLLKNGVSALARGRQAGRLFSLLFPLYDTGSSDSAYAVGRVLNGMLFAGMLLAFAAVLLCYFYVNSKAFYYSVAPLAAFSFSAQILIQNLLMGLDIHDNFPFPSLVGLLQPTFIFVAVAAAVVILILARRGYADGRANEKRRG